MTVRGRQTPMAVVLVLAVGIAALVAACGTSGVPSGNYGLQAQGRLGPFRLQAPATGRT